MSEEIVYFELNDWLSYPEGEPFDTWLLDENCDTYLRNKDWIKENKIVVCHSFVDQSLNYCITATKQWVEDICPELFTKYKQCLRLPIETGEVLGQFGCPFLPYTEENIGFHHFEEKREYVEEEWWGDKTETQEKIRNFMHKRLNGMYDLKYDEAQIYELIRIGYLDYTHIIEVCIDDFIKIPHFYVKHKDFGLYRIGIGLKTSEYIYAAEWEYKFCLNQDMRKALQKFMIAKPDTDSDIYNKYENNWKLTCAIWNESNPDVPIENNTVQPCYEEIDCEITKNMVDLAIEKGIIQIIHHPWKDVGTAFTIGTDYGWYFENDNVEDLANTLDPEDFLQKANHNDIVDDIYEDIISRKEEDPDAYSYFLKLFKDYCFIFEIWNENGE